MSEAGASPPVAEAGGKQHSTGSEDERAEGLTSGATASSRADVPALDTAAVPRATYRVQLHAGFRFDDAAALGPYLAALGVSHLYTSPFLRARAGSMHGYDIVDHAQLNPEIGDEAAYERLCDALAAQGIGQLADVVPNHMGVLEADNAWWLDVLANGPASAYAETFDIDWTPAPGQAAAQVLMPVLGAQYGEVLEAGELVLVFDEAQAAFRIDYHEHRFPLDPGDSAAVLGRLPPPEEAAAEATVLLAAFAALPARDDDARGRRGLRRALVPRLQAALRALVAQHAAVRDWVEACVATYAGRPGEASSFDELDALIQRQAWRAAYWRVAGDEINYRRFFDVNTLAALRMDRAEVFEAAHARLLQWLGEGRIAGLRIDHPDGLSDPLQYFRRLQAAYVARQREAGVETPRALYLLIEKILAPHEHWPASWPVHGDTGYRFGQLVGGLFVDGRQAEAFDRLYEDFVGEAVDYEAELLAAKRDVMEQSLAADLYVLTQRAHRIAVADRRTRDFTRNGLRRAIVELAAAFPVYRTYLGGAQPDPDGAATDRRHLDWALAAALRAGVAELSALQWLHALLLDEGAEADTARRAARLGVVQRFQQFTAPVMAKSMEDTAFYRYHRLVALNEVGGEPRQFGTSVAAFHAANVQRQRFLPHCMLGTSTHDSKRSEDVRARLAVLSEMPQAWREALERWRAAGAPRAERAEGDAAIAPNDELLLYQSVVGIWPPGQVDEVALADLRERIQAYLLKALREAKQRSSWLRPDEAYEGAVARFVELLLGRLEPNPALSDLRTFVEGIAPFGAWNSLNQLLFKLTAPGVPDIYQGCEVWNWSLVDPDNRRPVDHARHAAMLAALQQASSGDARAAELAELRRDWAAGRLKLDLCWRLLQWRAEAPALFRDGRYLPITVEGPAAEHVVAYARQTADGQGWALVVGTRLLHTLVGGMAGEVCEEGAAWAARWRDTRLVLPVEAPRDWVDRLSGRTHASQPGNESSGAVMAIGPLLADLPFAALRSGGDKL